MRSWKGCGSQRSWAASFRVISRISPGGSEENYKKLRIAGQRAEIWTWNVTNTNHECWAIRRCLYGPRAFPCNTASICPIKNSSPIYKKFLTSSVLVSNYHIFIFSLFHDAFSVSNSYYRANYHYKQLFSSVRNVKWRPSSRITWRLGVTHVNRSNRN
jgi:hypothetical protein